MSSERESGIPAGGPGPQSRPSQPHLRHGVPLAVVLGAMLLLGLGTLLALNTASAAQELRQRSLTESNAELSDTDQQLLRDLAQKQAPEALASEAAAMGLIPNSNPAFLKIGADGSVTILGVPAPASVPPAPTASAVPKPTATAPAATPPAATSPTGTAPAAPKPSVTAPAAPKPSVTAPAAPKPSVTAPAAPKPSVTAPAAPKPTGTPR